MEPRILFDGAALSTALSADMALDPHAEADTAQPDSLDAVTQTTATIAPDQTETIDAADSARIEVVFIDSALPDYQTLMDAVPEGAEIFVVDSDVDGWAYMAEALAGRSDIDAIHILGHGSTGMANLGSAQLYSDRLADYATEIREIGAALAADGDILLYGCSVASDRIGVSFDESFADAASADVAASDDITGAASLGGDWELEYQTGPIESVFLDIPDYDHALIPFSISGGTNPEGTTTITGNQSITASDVWSISINSNPNGFGIYAGSTNVTSGWSVGNWLDGGTWSLTVPGNLAPGNYTVTWTTVDTGADPDVSYETTFSFAIEASNTNPTTSGGSTTVSEGSSGTIYLSNGNTGSYDADGDSLSYSPSSISYNVASNPSLSGTHFYSSTGYTVNDGNGGSASGTYTIYATYIDDPTTWSSTPSNQTWNSVGTNSYFWASGASDPDSSVSYSYLGGAPSWMYTGSTLSGNVAPEYAGQTYTIQVRATGSTSVDSAFTITTGTAAQVNDLPTAG
ncbi:MAG: DUF4347 domain-containing protein, partial [Candidatus Thiodiazotropha sp.]